MAVRAHHLYLGLRIVWHDDAAPQGRRPQTVVRELVANIEDVGIWRRHPIEDRDLFFYQRSSVDPTRSIRGHISNASCLTGSSNTPEYRHTLDQRDPGPDGVCI